MEIGLYESPHRRALYHWCLTERPTVGQGTPYGCHEVDLENCASVYNKRPHAPRSIESATTELERFLDPSVGLEIGCPEMTAILRLQNGLRIQDWKPDLIVKAFRDLDIAFFDSTLQCHTSFNWRCAEWWNELRRSPTAYRGPLGMTQILGRGKAAIELNAWGILLDSEDANLEMWRVTLHEMVVS